ncbi:hypothetical protein TNCV_2036371 [Trichonephila clavipes]|nr:hypothetical protein TNCV_2036371 [Trichonephila clavipes]
MIILTHFAEIDSQGEEGGESDPVDDETDEDENNINDGSSKGPSNADAVSALETAMERYEQQSESSPTLLLLLKRIRDLSAKREEIRDFYGAICLYIHKVSQDHWDKLKGEVGNIIRTQICTATHGRKHLRLALGGVVHKIIGGNRPALSQSFEL